MEIHMLDGTTSRPAKQVKAVQILRSQRADLDSKRIVQTHAFALSEKEEKREKELERMLNKADQEQTKYQQRLDEAPLGSRSQTDDLATKLQSTVDFAEAELQAQREVSYLAHAASLKAERQVQALERLEVKNREVEQHYDQQAKRELANRKARAEMVNTSEIKAADTLEARHKQRIRAYERQIQETSMLRQTQADSAQVYHTEAIQRMMTSTATTMNVMRDLKAKREADHAHRIDSVLSLKANSDAAFSKLKGANERRAKRQEAIATARQAEFSALETKGENPYKVFRTREVVANAAKTRAAQLAKVAEKEAELVRRILVEDEYTRKKNTEARHAKEQEQKFRDELGRHVIEERNSQYLLSRTTAKVDMVNPTGRGTRSFEPSQVTTIKDNSFGLGFNPRLDAEKHANVVQMVAAKPQNAGIELGEFSRFLPKISNSLSMDAGIGEDGRDGDGLSDFVETSATTGIIALQESKSSKIHNEGEKGPHLLSKFELDCRLKAQERQREALAQGQPQVAAGRVFSGGQAFTPKPTKVEFLDFEVGKTYKRKVVLTNVSLSFNSFKVLNLPDSVRDFFEINYAKPGRMSAGTTCVVEVTFRPQVNEDLATELPLLTETGPCAIPITCRTRKVVPSVEVDHIAFGDVVMGEVRHLKIVIKNSGCIPCFYEVLDMATGLTIGNSKRTAQVEPEVDEMEESTPENNMNLGNEEKAVQDDVPTEEFRSEMAAAVAKELELQLVAEKQLLGEAEKVSSAALAYPEGCGAIQFESHGSVDSYSEAYHVITFAPLSAGYYVQNIALRFSGCDTVIPIGITGTAELFPVYVAEPVVDFRMVVLDKLYRKKLVLCNRGKIAFKVQAVVPNELAGILEFGPDMGFVQPGVNFEVGLKLRPGRDMLEACRNVSIGGAEPRSFVVEGCDVIAVPIHILVPKQAIPVFFTLKCQLTSGRVELGSSDINFGPCYTTERLVSRLELSNMSRLPQKFGFVNLSQDLDVQPHDGFGVLLPFERRSVDVCFGPTSASTSNSMLELRTSMGDCYRIPVSGIGVDPPLLLSHSVLELTPAAVGDTVIESVLITNPSHTETLLFEWGVPLPEVSGLVVSPSVAQLKPGQQVRVEVQFKPKLVPGTDEKVAQVVPEEMGEQTFSSDDEPWSVHSRWNLPCVVKTLSQEVSSVPPMYLVVQTVVVERVLELSTSTLDFGELAVGQVKVMNLRVFNHKETPAILTTSGLNAIGPFSILNALRPVPPNSYSTVMVQFAPEAQGVRQESLTLHAASIGSSLHLSLRGDGVSPNLIIDPPDGRIDLGHCLEMDSTESELTLHNASVFPLTFKLEPVGDPSLNFNNQSPFSIIPSEASVQPGVDLKVKVLFLPDHERDWPYQQLVRVVVPNQVKEHCLHLIGRCEARQMYVSGSEDEESAQPEDREDPLLMPANVNIGVGFGEKEVDKPNIKLTFPRDDPQAIRQVTVGSVDITDNEAFPGSAGAYSLEWSDENVYFSASADNGNVAVGSSMPITFKFNPPEIKETYGLDVGQWARTMVKLRLTGGFSHSHAKHETVNILLEGYIQI